MPHFRASLSLARALLLLGLVPPFAGHGKVAPDAREVAGCMSNSTSLDLLRRLEDPASARAWPDFIAKYEPFIDRQLRSLGLQPSDVSDVRQDVMCILVSEMPGFEHSGNKGAFRHWLRRVVANQLKKHFRKRHLAGRRIDQGFPEQFDQLCDDGSEVSVSFEREHQRFLIQELINRVAERFDESTMVAFRRQFIDDASPRTVADELGRTTDAVIAAKYRVMKALRETKQSIPGLADDD